MKRHLLLTFTLAFICLDQADLVYAQTTKEQILTCQEQKLRATRQTKDFTHTKDLVCHPGHPDLFRGCVDREVKREPISYSAPDGHKIVEASVKENSRTSRTGLDGFTWNSRSASASLSCDGNGCGGEGRVWIDVSIVGKIERVPTEGERNDVLKVCLDELLK